MKGSVLSFIMIVFMIAVSCAFKQQQATWKAPAEANKLVNPVKGDSVATAEGEKLFNAQCAVCHGITGKGDGMAGASLTPRPADFQSAGVKNQTDGAIFWKITNGKAPMPAFVALSEMQRWQLVNYIRKLETGTVTEKNAPGDNGMMHNCTMGNMMNH